MKNRIVKKIKKFLFFFTISINHNIYHAFISGFLNLKSQIIVPFEGFMFLPEKMIETLKLILFRMIRASVHPIYQEPIRMVGTLE